MNDRPFIKSLDSVKPSYYLDYKLFLQALYAHKKSLEDQYSYQSFADDLGFGMTTVMHQIIKGYRPLSSKAAVQVVRQLDYEKGERDYFLALVAYCNAKTAVAREQAFNELKIIKRDLLPTNLDRNLLEYFGKWYHPIIWELVGTQGFQSDPGWISRRVVPTISVQAAKESLELLLELDLIAEQAGHYVQTQNRVTTGPQTKGIALVSYHQNMIEHSLNALVKMTAERRDISAMTVSVSEEGAKRLRAMIHAFQIQLLDEAERCENSDQVYQINIQLFPFTE